MDENVEVSVQDTGAEVTEPAEPSSTISEAQSDNTEVSATEVPKQSAEDNARYAAARREAEAQTRELQGKISRTNALVAEMCKGKVNPITKQEITTADEYFEAVKAQEMLSRQNELVRQGVNLNDLNAYMAETLKNNPTIREAERVIAIEKERTAELEKQQIAQQVDDDVKEISRQFDSSIKSVNDLIARDPNGFNEMINLCAQKNLTLYEAYALRNLRSNMQNIADKAKQQAINQVNGKSHLGTASPATENGFEVPQDMMERLHKTFPKATKSELRKLYDRTMKTYN